MTERRGRRRGGRRLLKGLLGPAAFGRGAPLSPAMRQLVRIFVCGVALIAGVVLLGTFFEEELGGNLSILFLLGWLLLAGMTARYFRLLGQKEK